MSVDIYKIWIETDNNRSVLDIVSNFDKPYNSKESDNTVCSNKRAVYKESFSCLQAAKRREKQLSSYARIQLDKLIRKNNPNWLTILIGDLNHTKNPYHDLSHNKGLYLSI